MGSELELLTISCCRITVAKDQEGSMRSRARQMLDKSVSSMLSAIEIYNKPNFLYREELFTILIVNAWELFLKSKILIVF